MTGIFVAIRRSASAGRSAKSDVGTSVKSPFRPYGIGLMGQIGSSCRRDATGDVGHRPSAATHAKSLARNSHHGWGFRCDPAVRPGRSKREERCGTSVERFDAPGSRRIATLRAVASDRQGASSRLPDGPGIARRGFPALSRRGGRENPGHGGKYGLVTPPKAGLSCAVAASRFLPDAPHRAAKRSLPRRKGGRSNRFDKVGKCSWPIRGADKVIFPLSKVRDRVQRDDKQS